MVKSLQQAPSATRREDAHLMDGDFVESFETLGLEDAVLDHHGVGILHFQQALTSHALNNALSRRAFQG